MTAGRRILIVDDNRDAAETLMDFLQILGHDVTTAADGLAALQAVEMSAPEIVLLDLGLPLLDGFEVARRLRERYGPQVKLWALTGYGQSSDRKKSQEAGFDRHLVKPVDLEILETLLAEK